MRRLLAILLLGLLNFALLAPLAAPAQSQLPPCCRANGKHKCLMRRALLDQRDGASSITPLPDRCPFSSGLASTAAIPSQAITNRAVGTAIVRMAIQSIAWVEDPRETPIVFSRTRQKRGPPDLLS